ncbi:hypothetical protein QFC21_003166 [Naganishia friedmannii]|uniref:Uncharacterized protein n=1 Tax=Naganishia friedmannii TaxID=89922 RepID=A0ACC2VRS8_9TREE|nr:hypothetical protein QFC21_003166 [Naganishia friedmannii]
MPGRSPGTESHVVEGLKTSLPTVTVSPVISGFPMHNADKATLDSFRNAQQIKDQQRELIQKRRQGRAPLTVESPGVGPPPSAGVIPPMMYLHKNSVGSRRSEAVKQKVRGMRVFTGSECGGRENGSKTAPVGQSQRPQQPAHAAQSSHMRTTAYPDDGQDEDELMQDDTPTQHGTAAVPEGGHVYSGQRPSQLPPPARHPPQTAHPNLGGYPQGYAAPRYVNGDHRDDVHPAKRRRSLSGYVQPGVASSTRARSPPAYAPGTAYDAAQPGVYLPRLAQMSVANGPPTAGPARGEYPPGTRYRPRQVSHYPSANGAGAFANGPIDVNREHFMEPFHLLYDAFIDSMHLKRDLESKILRANDLVEAQEAELRRIAGLRIEYERTLDRLQKDQERLSQQSPSRPEGHRKNTSPPLSGGSDGQRAATAPRAESAEQDREVEELRLELQQTERETR